MYDGSEFPSVVGVVGGGQMGAGIAHVLLQAGCSVVLVEGTEESLATALHRVRTGLDAAADRGKLAGEPGELAARLTGAVDIGGPDGLAGCQLVVEAVPELPDLKTTVLRAVEAVVAEDAVLATNTSSISVTEIGAHLRAPTRFLGLHFFNPVPASALVEIVVGERTDPGLVARARAWTAALGKESVVVNDRPGFATSRLGVLLGLEAMRILAEGVASVEDIDRAMVLGYRHPIGPLRLSDLVGLDVRLGVAEYLAARLGERFAPPPLLREMVARGDLGRKTGRGFYVW